MEDKNIKLIAMDMDGTLLNSRQEVTDYTVQVIKKAMEKGIYIVPATGRSVNGLPEELTDMQGLRYCILCNGATVYDLHKQEAIYTNHFSMEEIIKLLHAVMPYDAFRSISKDGKVYSSKEQMEHLGLFELGEYAEDMIRSSRTPVDDLENFIRRDGGTSEKMTLYFAGQEERQRAREDLLERGLYKVVASLGNNLEISLKSCTKGDALRHLADHLNLSRENIMSCGDAENDYEMMMESGIGVVMSNGTDEMKKIADYITDSNDEDGVARAIEKLALKVWC